MDNREGKIVSNITYTNNTFTCYAKKVNVCINLTNSKYRYTKLNWHSLIFDIIRSRSVHHSVTFGVY